MITYITSFPRLHIGLLDLGFATHRAYGGGGFSLNWPAIQVSAEPKSKWDLRGLDKLDQRAKEDVYASLKRLQYRLGDRAARLTLHKVAPEHVGLGSKTALLLAIVTAATHATGVKLNQQSLQSICGRGGASGIGVNAFFRGGFIIDGGHDAAFKKDLLPSSVQRPFETPPIICRSAIPTAWRFHLILPSSRGASGSTEVDFFKKHTPVPRSEVLESIALMYHGVAPAVLKGRLSLIKDSLRELHKIGFKHQELKAQSSTTQLILNALDRETNGAVGLSSRGPLIYVITDRNCLGTVRHIESLCRDYAVKYIGCYSGRSKGYQLETSTNEEYYPTASPNEVDSMLR